jgi:hypothetical protein
MGHQIKQPMGKNRYTHDDGNPPSSPPKHQAVTDRPRCRHNKRVGPRSDEVLKRSTFDTEPYSYGKDQVQETNPDHDAECGSLRLGYLQRESSRKMTRVH